MQYLSSYYWQQERSKQISLVLQQLIYPRGRISVLFGCICWGGAAETADNKYMNRYMNGYMIERITEWYRKHRAKLVDAFRKSKAGEALEQISQELSKLIMETEGKIVHGNGGDGSVLQIQGIFCVGDRVLLFNKGNGKVLFVNSRFNNTTFRLLTGQERESLEIFTGKMESGIGLLLGTGAFLQGLTEEEIRKAIAVRTLRKASHVEECLEQLGRKAELEGGNPMGALLLVTR